MQLIELFSNIMYRSTNTCNSGASGFSWWSYADYFWAPNNSTNRGTNYFGLLKREITTCPDPLNPCQAMNKPAASVFQILATTLYHR